MSPKRRKQKHNNAKDDFESIILDLARVTRVQRGGKRLRFRVTVGVGNRKGKVGIGVSKGTDVSIAVEKATRAARKKLVKCPITEKASIPHKIEIKYKAGHILLKPAPVGTGIKAGGVVRTLCDLAGIENISAKILGTNNKLTNAKTLIQAFKKFKNND